MCFIFPMAKLISGGKDVDRCHICITMMIIVMSMIMMMIIVMSMIMIMMMMMVAINNIMAKQSEGAVS